MFIIGGLGYIIPAIFFCFFGSANIQKWNEIIIPIDDQDKNKIEVNSAHLFKATIDVSIDNEQTKL